MIHTTFYYVDVERPNDHTEILLSVVIPYPVRLGEKVDIGDQQDWTVSEVTWKFESSPENPDYPYASLLVRVV